MPAGSKFRFGLFNFSKVPPKHFDMVRNSVSAGSPKQNFSFSHILFLWLIHCGFELFLTLPKLALTVKYRISTIFPVVLGLQIPHSYIRIDWYFVFPMRQSTLFTKTRKEAPKDEVAKNAELLIRAGYIHKEMAGVYSYLPLGL